MNVLELKDQRRIVKVIEYLVETQQRNTTVGDVMRRFGLTAEEYRMCSNLAVPALAQGNINIRFKAVRDVNRAMRRDLETLNGAVKDEEGVAAEGVRLMYNTWCARHRQNVVYGKAEDDAPSEDGGDGALWKRDEQP